MKNGFGIRNRWLARQFAVVSTIVVLLCALVVLWMTTSTIADLRSNLESLVTANTTFFQDYLEETDSSYYDSSVSFAQDFSGKNNLVLEILDQNGNLVSSSFELVANGKANTPDIAEVLSEQKLASFRGKDPETGSRIISVSGPVVLSGGKTVGVLRIVSSLRLVHRKIITWSFMALAVALMAILVQLLTGLWFLRRAVIPVADVTEVAKRIASGGYGVQIQREFGDNNDEIGELTRTINNLSLQISQTEKLQAEFLSSCSHELRTPLTAISGWAETLLGSEEMDPEFTRRGMGTILNEAKRLTSLVMELLEFSRIQDGRFKLNVEECDLRTVFEDTIFMYGTQLSQQGITLNYDYSEDEVPEIRCDPERMKQVFLNILDNAAKYGGDGGRIDCSIHADEDELTVLIRDYGQGIPEDELPLVKKKFYKGSAGTRGNGIGLAVCEEIVTVHGGELTIANAEDENGGCLVTIELPYK